MQEREEKQRELLLIMNSNSVWGQVQAVPSYPAVVVNISSPREREGERERGKGGGEVRKRNRVRERGR